MNCDAASSARHGIFLPMIHVYLVLGAKNGMYNTSLEVYTTVVLNLLLLLLLF